MIKILVLQAILLITTSGAYAEAPCDIRPGTSVGIKVVEFYSKNLIHSKMPIRESTAEALLEEIVNLQDEGICEEKITPRKCVLKYEKISNLNYVSLYRNQLRWNSWNLLSKDQALTYTKSLKRAGFCN
jgi:hypothetical protein